MGGENERAVIEACKALVHGVIKPAGILLGARRIREVGPARGADEERVAREDAPAARPAVGGWTA